MKKKDRLKADAMGLNNLFDKNTSDILFMNIDEINLLPDHVNFFPINDDVYNSILTSIETSGFDQFQPLYIQKSTNILLDGHTRRKAVLEHNKKHPNKKIEKLPVIEIETDDAKNLIRRLQFFRRNLEVRECIPYIKDSLESYDKSLHPGGKALYLSKIYPISEGVLKQLLVILERASEIDIKRLITGEESVYSIYKKVRAASENKPKLNPYSSKKVDVKFTIKNNNQIHYKNKLILSYNETELDNSVVKKIQRILAEYYGKKGN